MEARSRAGSGDCMMQCSSEAWAFWEEGRERWPGGGVKRGEGGKEKNEEVEGLQHTLHMYMRKGLGIFLENCEKPAATRD